MESYLQAILKSDKRTIVFKTNRPRVIAHLLRQAFVASKIAENEYKELKDVWRVKEQTACIILTKKAPPVILESLQAEQVEVEIVGETIINPTETEIVENVSVQEVAPQPVVEVAQEIEIIQDAGIPCPSVTRIEEVIGAILENRGKNLVFPKYRPTAQDLAVLERWGAAYSVTFHYTNSILTARQV